MFGDVLAKTRLLALREVQKLHGPNYCLGAAKFFCGKVSGLFDETKHLNDFINSPWARKHRGINLTAAWGLFKGGSDFNSKVLPAAVNDATGNVKASGTTKMDVEFHHFGGNTTLADSLLKSGVALVVGVDMPGGSRRDHFVSVVQDGAKRMWVVDPWGDWIDFALAELPSDFTFTKPVKVDLNVAEDVSTVAKELTTVPCTPTWTGFYRDKKTKSALTIKSAF